MVGLLGHATLLAADHGEIFEPIPVSSSLPASCSAQRATLIRSRNEGRIADDVMHST
jgi:hypothetical protein